MWRRDWPVLVAAVPPARPGVLLQGPGVAGELVEVTVGYGDWPRRHGPLLSVCTRRLQRSRHGSDGSHLLFDTSALRNAVILEVVSDTLIAAQPTPPPVRWRHPDENDGKIGSAFVAVDGASSPAETVQVRDWWGLAWAGADAACMVLGRQVALECVALVSSYRLGSYLHQVWSPGRKPALPEAYAFGRHEQQRGQEG